MNISIEIPNIEKVKAALDSYPVTSAKHVDRAIRNSVKKVLASAKDLTPVARPMTWKRPNPRYSPGRLKGSYMTTFAPLQATIEPKVDYAYWVHEGTSRMAPRPFLKEAVDYTQAYVERYFESAVAATLDEIAYKAG